VSFGETMRSHGLFLFCLFIYFAKAVEPWVRSHGFSMLNMILSTPSVLVLCSSSFLPKYLSLFFPLCYCYAYS
jgi:hypothetical protein